MLKPSYTPQGLQWSSSGAPAATVAEALLSCVSAQPAHVIVSDPLRFANDSSPIRDGGAAPRPQLGPPPPPLQRQGSSLTASKAVSHSGPPPKGVVL